MQKYLIFRVMQKYLIFRVIFKKIKVVSQKLAVYFVVHLISTPIPQPVQASKVGQRAEPKGSCDYVQVEIFHDQHGLKSFLKPNPLVNGVTGVFNYSSCCKSNEQCERDMR